MNGRRVVVSGIGAVAAPGKCVPEIRTALRRLDPQTTRQSPPAWIQPRALPSGPAESATVFLAAGPEADAVRKPRRWDAVMRDLAMAAYRDLRYTAAAIEEALADAALTYDGSDNTVGAVLAFEAPGMERVVAALFDGWSASQDSDSVGRQIAALGEAFYRTQSFLYTHAAGRLFQLHGFATCLNNACSSGLHALNVAAGFIRSGRAEAMIVAGGEAFDTAVRVAYFQRQGFYGADGLVRPFADKPTGFVVGEGAAALLLEPLDRVVARGGKALVEVHPAAFAQQSWRQTLPNVRDRRLAGVIRDALIRATIRPADIDAVVPHGAATSVSDRYELDCLGEALDRDAPLYAFKGLTGHLLGASVLLDLVIVIDAMAGDGLPASARCRGDTEVPAGTPADALTKANTVLKCATGFTGHDAAVVLTTPTRG